MKAILAVAFAVLTAARTVAADPVLGFPTATGVAGLELDLTVEGKAPEAVWAKFLDRLFDHFDRDANGSLSAAETARVFPLPLPKGQEAKADFAKLDADGDGKADRAEFRAYYLAAGFTPVVASVESAAVEVFALGEAVFRQLDRNHDGELSAVELKNAPALLNRFDDNEDEVLTAGELLVGFSFDAKPITAITLVKASPAARLSLPLTGPPVLTASPYFALSKDATILSVPQGSCVLSRRGDDPTASVRAAAGFSLAQFQDAGDKPTAKAVFENDPAAQVLAGLFDTADRDGDGQLTRTELEGFFSLVEAGVGCRVVVALEDRGRNVFDALDANGDGRLDVRELRGAAERVPAAKPVPASYRLTVARGSVGRSFGPLPLAAVAVPKVVPKAAATGPAWFQAMDRNRNGSVSAAEFLGPPTRFAELDSDNDGHISAAEAAGR